MALVDSYSESNYYDGYFAVSAETTFSQSAGQSFTGNGGVLSSCQFYMRRSLNPPGYAHAKVYAHTQTWGTNGIPTGAYLAVSDDFTPGGLTTSFALATLTFSGANKITLTNGVHYVIQLEYTDGDVTNYVRVAYDNSTPTHAGNASRYLSGGWTSSSTDVCFYVYSDEAGSSPSASPSGSPSASPSTSASPSSSPSAGPLVDSYSEVNRDAYHSVSNTVEVCCGQSFTGDGSVLDRAEFWLRATGAPTGNAYAKIYYETHAIAFGTDSVAMGSALATSTAFDVSTLTTSYALIPFTFSGGGKIPLDAGAKYVVVCEYTGGDVNNGIRVGTDVSTPTHNGNLVYYYSSWKATAGSDTCFYVYGDEASSASASTSASASASTSGSPSASPSVSPSASASPAPGDLIDSYSYLEATIALPLSSETYLEFGQSFTGNGKAADICRFYIAKVGSPTGYCRAKIYNETNETAFGIDSIGSGTAIATSNDYDVSLLSNSYIALIDFTFPGETVLNNLFKYVVVLEYTGGDNDNYLAIGADIDAPSHDGNTCFYSSSYGWDSFSNMDTCFYVWGKALGSASISASPSASPSFSHSISASPSVSPSGSVSASPSASQSASPSSSPSPSQKKGGTIILTGRGYSASSSPSASPSRSPSASPSASASSSPSHSTSASSSSSPSSSVSSSPSSSPSPSSSVSDSPSSSPSRSASASPSASLSGSPSASPSRSASASPSPSPSPSGGGGNVIAGKKATKTYFRKRKPVEKPEE